MRWAEALGDVEKKRLPLDSDSPRREAMLNLLRRVARTVFRTVAVNFVDQFVELKQFDRRPFDM
jgi:hypothetical protein